MFFLVEIITTDVISKAVWEKNSLDDAIMALHQTMASAMANENVKTCLCMIIDGLGRTLRDEFWERPLPPYVPPAEAEG